MPKLMNYIAEKHISFSTGDLTIKPGFKTSKIFRHLLFQKIKCEKVVLFNEKEKDNFISFI